jgi:hypothetical protein
LIGASCVAELRTAPEQQLRHHAARRDRTGGDFLAQRALGGLVRRRSLTTVATMASGMRT